MSDNLTLEHLPNEIFQELFEYFDSYELYTTFSRLTYRIDSLITNFKYLQITLYSPDDIDRRVNRYLLPKAKTLIIDHSKSFCDPENSTILSHIRCLILCQPTREQWNSVHSLHFPNLERLYLINSRFVYRTEELCRLLFSNAFCYLHSCSLPHIPYQVNNQWTVTPSLRSLQINIWDIRVYTQILHACPNLRRLRIELSGGTNEETFTLSHSNIEHSALRCLALYSSSPMKCEFIDSILSAVSGLNHFVLAINRHRPSHMSMDALATILEYRTPKLNRVRIDIALPDNLCCAQQMRTKYLLFNSWKILSKLNRPSRLLIVGSV